MIRVSLRLAVCAFAWLLALGRAPKPAWDRPPPPPPPVPDPTRGGGLLRPVQHPQPVRRDRPGARQPLGRVKLAFPADVLAQVGLGEGHRRGLVGPARERR